MLCIFLQVNKIQVRYLSYLFTTQGLMLDPTHIQDMPQFFPSCHQGQPERLSQARRLLKELGSQFLLVCTTLSFPFKGQEAQSYCLK